MIGGIVNKTREDEREESKRDRKKKKKREKETGERERPPVCAFNTSPCVRQNVPVCTGNMPHEKKTCGHVAGTHGDILNARTGTC